MESVKVLELQTSKIEVESASTWSRGGRQNKVIKKADVWLVYNGEKYHIDEHKVVHKILKSLDSELNYNEYSSIVNANPLKEILEEYFTHYNEVVVVMVLNGVIGGVVGKDATTWVEANAVVLEEIRGYCEGRLGCGLDTRVFIKPDGAYYRLTHMDGQRNIEIIQMDKEVKVRARYDTGAGFVQPIDPVIFKGKISGLEAEKFYDVLDTFIDEINKMENAMFRSNIPLKDTTNMKPKEQDAMERAWFNNYFLNSNK